MLNRFIICWLLICALRGLLTLSVDTEPSIDVEALRKAKSEEMLKYMNESADPCENFFDFACGNWKTYYPASSNETRTGTFQMQFNIFGDKLLQRLKNVDKTDSKSVRKMYDFYNSCINFTMDRSDFKDQVKELANQFNQMPALVGDKWQEDEFDWQQSVAQINNKYKIIIIIGFDFIQNQQEHNSYDIHLMGEYKAGLYEKDYYISARENFLTKYLGLENEKAKQVALELYDFEISLYKASAYSYEDKEINTVQEIHDTYYPDLDIKRLVNISFGYIPTDEIINKNPDFLENLIEVMKNTPKKVVANYVSISLILQFLYSDNKMDGAEVQKELCIRDTKMYFNDIMSSMFYRSKSVKEQELYIEQIWLVAKSYFQMVLESSALTWFDEKSREFALEKLHWLKLLVPSQQDEDFDEVYKHLHINESDYFENVKAVKKFETIKFRKSVNLTNPYIALIDKPLFYSLTSNIIGITVDQLTSDFLYSPFYPKAYNYARLVYILFHEVIHGFSGDGRHYDRLGDQIGKWEKKIEREFEKRRKCLYDQYTNYTFNGESLPQDPLQEENASDNAGILLAYQMYRRWYEDSERSKEELDMEALPNLNYTSMQLFFISFSQTWCGDAFRVNIYDTHTLDQFRAFVPLVNLDAFSEEFKCPKGSPMNPIKKCRIY